MKVKEAVKSAKPRTCQALVLHLWELGSSSPWGPKWKVQ